MSKAATVLGLVAVAAAGVPAYGSSAAPAYGSSAPVYSADPSSAWPVSSAAPSYPAASSEPAVYGSSWGSVVPSSSYVVSAIPSSSYASYYASSSAVIPSSSPYPACWTECFAEAGITSESDLCGNEEVDKCVHDTCCQAESWAYWQWYDSYCPAASSSSYVIPSSTYPVYPVSSSSAAATPTPDCWSECFAENQVTSEADLCGNDAVSACIHDTCCAALDKAYWDWYIGYCAAPSSSVVVVTTVYTPTGPAPTSPVTTTYEYTSPYGYTPVGTAPATTGLPVPPVSPVAPYGTYPAPTGTASGVAAPTGYGAPSASAWSPVPATGAGAATKPGVFLAAAMALAALF